MKKYIIFLLLLLIIGSCGKDKKNLELKSPENTSKEQITDNKEQTTDNKEQINSQLPIISAKDAGNNIGKSVCVKGYIADVTIRPKVAYLNFDYKYPKNTFAVVIFPSDFSKFGDLKTFANRNVIVNGTITTYNNKPQMILNSVSQITISDK